MLLLVSVQPLMCSVNPIHLQGSKYFTQIFKSAKNRFAFFPLQLCYCRNVFERSTCIYFVWIPRHWRQLTL